MLTLPNFLSFLRLVGIIPVFLFFQGQAGVIPFLLVLFLALTDFLDGYLARKLNVQSNTGALLDPIADKVFNISGFVILYYYQETGLLLFALILLRNSLQLASIPILVNWKKISFKVEPKWPAKWATGLAMTMVVSHFFPFGTLIPFDPMLFNSLHYLIFVGLQILCIGLEAYILLTFSFRFWQIYHGKHDTFH